MNTGADMPRNTGAVIARRQPRDHFRGSTHAAQRVIIANLGHTRRRQIGVTNGIDFLS